MWKSRDNKIQEQFHPKHLYDFLEFEEEKDDKDIDEFLNRWI